MGEDLRAETEEPPPAASGLCASRDLPAAIRRCSMAIADQFGADLGDHIVDLGSDQANITFPWPIVTQTAWCSVSTGCRDAGDAPSPARQSSPLASGRFASARQCCPAPIFSLALPALW